MPLASFLLEPGQVDEGFSRPGRCAEHVLVEACGLDTLLEAGHQSLADKGFLMHAHCTAVGHELITPWKKRKGHLGSGEAGSKQQDRVRNCSVHVERAFAMVQHGKILRRRVQISEVDVFDTAWTICSLMCNYDLTSSNNEDG